MKPLTTRLHVLFRVVLLGLALCCLHATAQSPGEDAEARYTEDGQSALAAGHYRAAEENFLALEKLNPGVAEVHATLGLVYFQEQKYADAVRELRLAKKIKPGLNKLDSLLAMSLSELGNYKEALPELEKAFRQSSDPAVKRMSGLQLMRAYTQLKQDDKAVGLALEMNQLYPKDAEVLYNTSKIYGNYAFLTVRRLAEDAPNSVWRHLAAAEAYESQGASVEAIGEYRTVLTIDPRRRGIHYRIGRTLLSESHQNGEKADINEARKEFELELDTDPQNGNAAYEIAEIHRRAGQLDLAQQFFERALLQYPNFEEAQDGLAAVFLAEDKPEQALPHLKAALALDPNDEVSWYRLSQVERKLGDSSGQQDALAHFRSLHQTALDRQSSRILAPPTDVTKQEVDPQVQP